MRKDFILAKYTEKRFAQRKYADNAGRLHALSDAVKTRDIFSLIQVYAEGVDLMETIHQPNEHVSFSVDYLELKMTFMEIFYNNSGLPLQEAGETALHLAVRMVDRNSLHIVDFLVQNRSENALLC